MKYIMFILSFGFLVGNTVRAEDVNTGSDDTAVEQNDENRDANALNLEDGNSSNYGWWNLGYNRFYSGYGYGYGYGYPYYGYGYGYGCNRAYPSYSWGFYNQDYLYRVPPMVR